MARKSPRKSRSDAETRLGFQMGALGFEVVAQVGGGIVLGWLFDRWRGTAPTGLLVGAVLGIALGLTNLVRGALKLQRRLDAAHPVRPPADGWETIEDDDDDADPDDDFNRPRYDA